MCRPAGGIPNGAERAPRSLLSPIEVKALLAGIIEQQQTLIGDDECVVKKHLNIGIPPSANEQTVNAFRIAFPDVRRSCGRLWHASCQNI